MASGNYQQKQLLIQRRQPPQLMMLKDYLLRDDFSSCSSNGFKSFPRRQCCTTIRFLLETDLKSKHHHSTSSRNQHKKQRQQQQQVLLLKRRRSSAISSALQRASEAVIKAVKLLPLPSSSSSATEANGSSSSRSLLPRSFSRKVFKKSIFWQKDDDDNRGGKEEIGQWRLFRDFLLLDQEKLSPDDELQITTVKKETTATAVTTSCSGRISTSSSSNNHSWTESEFTVRAGSSNSESYRGGNDAAEGESAASKVSGRDGAGDSVGQDSITTYPKWPNGEKQQFSPVSVLECPFQDDEEEEAEEEEEEEEEISSPFQRRLARMEGAKQKLMHKIRRLESLAQLEPVDLEKRIAMAADHSDNDSLKSPKQPCSLSINDNNNSMFDKTCEREDGAERQAQELLKLVKATTCCLTSTADNLLLDFFMEKIDDRNNGSTGKLITEVQQENLLKVARDWMDGHPQEMYLGWEVEDGRQACIKDMGKNNQWRSLDEEKEEVALQLECDVFTSLLQEILHDILS